MLVAKGFEATLVSGSVRRTFVLLAALAFMSTCTESARAYDVSVRLNWRGPEDCQDDGSVSREIERIVGTSASVGDERLWVTANVSRRPDGNWLVRLRTRARSLTGERTLVGATCEEVRRATALIVALMLNPNVRVDPPSPEAPPAHSVPRSASKSPPAKQRAVMPSASALDLLLGVGLTGGIGVLPGAAMGLQLRAGAETSNWSVEARGEAWLPRRKVSDDSLGAGGDFRLLGADLRACYQRSERLGFGLCGGPGLRRMRAEGFGVSDPDSATAVWPALALEIFARLPIWKALGLRAAASGEFPFRPPTFRLAGLGDVHTPSSIAGQVDLGVELHF